MGKSLTVLRDDPELDGLPVFQEARLDRDALDCLLADLDDLADIVEVRVKGRDPSALSQAGFELLEARQLFLDGHAGALQIVYRFADRTWCDTLIADGIDTRLLRLEEP